MCSGTYECPAATIKPHLCLVFSPYILIGIIYLCVFGDVFFIWLSIDKITDSLFPPPSRLGEKNKALKTGKGRYFMLLSTLIGIFLFIPLMVSEHWCSEFWAGQKKSGLCSYTFQLFAFIYVNFLWLGPKLKALTTGLYAQYATVIISYCVVHNHVLVLPYLVLKTQIFIDWIF